MYNDLFFETREEAVDILGKMREIALEYGKATVADLRNLSGVSVKWADTQTYWSYDDLKNVSIHVVRHYGHYYYTILFPCPTCRRKPTVTYSKATEPIEPVNSTPHMIHITIDTDVHEDITDTLNQVFANIRSITDRDVFITIS